MKYIIQQITDFTSTNLTETVAEWSPTTTYALDAFARSGSYIYQSATNDNLAYNPINFVNIKWTKYSISNRFAMLDLSAGSKSAFDGDMTVTFLQNRMQTIAIGNYEADTILVEVLDLDGTTVMWSYEVPTAIYSGIVNWYTYLYNGYNYEVNKAIKVELGIVGTSVRVTFRKSTESTRTACGFLVGGVAVDMGLTKWGVGFKFNSFATKTFDAFGTFSVNKSIVQDLVDFNTEIESGTLKTKLRSIKSIYNDVVCFVVDDSNDTTYENLITLGVIQDVDTILDNGVTTNVSWSILEVVN